METFASQVWLDVGHPEYNTEEDPSLTARGLVFWGSGKETVLKAWPLAAQFQGKASNLGDPRFPCCNL